MRVLIFFLILITILSNCSFDNKSGIWSSKEEVNLKKKQFSSFETVNTEVETFNQIINPENNLKVLLDPVKLNIVWNNKYFNNTNKEVNFSYKDLNNVVTQSKKLIKKKANKNLLYKNNIITISNDKGDIIFYSTTAEEIKFKFNFYKKNFKRIPKVLYYTLENNILYIGDNLGYLYALNIDKKKLIWAKNYKVPFRSNLKILKNKLLISDINNSLYLINKTNGEKIKIIPTEDTIIKNNFVNSLVVEDNKIFYLNTYGSLYSLTNQGRIIWFINLNQSLDINPSNLFNSHPVIISNNKVIISSSLYLYVLDINNGSIIFKKAITSILRPLISNNNLFIITNDNLLVCKSLISGKILYSKNIDHDVANYLNQKKKKSLSVKNFSILNNSLFLLLNNSYSIRYAPNGEIFKIIKFKKEVYSNPIYINNSIMYLSKNNKLIIKN